MRHVQIPWWQCAAPIASFLFHTVWSITTSVCCIINLVVSLKPRFTYNNLFLVILCIFEGIPLIFMAPTLKNVVGVEICTTFICKNSLENGTLFVFLQFQMMIRKLGALFCPFHKSSKTTIYIVHLLCCHHKKALIKFYIFTKCRC